MYSGLVQQLVNNVPKIVGDNGRTSQVGACGA